MQTMHTLCGTVLRTSSIRIRNYADSDAETGTDGNFWLSYSAPRNIRTGKVMTLPQKLHSQLAGLVTAVMYQETGLAWFRLHGSATRVRHPQ